MINWQNIKNQNKNKSRIKFTLRVISPFLSSLKTFFKQFAIISLTFLFLLFVRGTIAWAMFWA